MFWLNYNCGRSCRSCTGCSTAACLMGGKREKSFTPISERTTSLDNPHFSTSSFTNGQQGLLRWRSAILPAARSTARTGGLLPSTAPTIIRRPTLRSTIRWTRVPTSTTTTDSLCSTTQSIQWWRWSYWLPGLPCWRMSLLLC
ncbi:hypothetical protein K503DRAFT_865122 [Rhizopogon vinicolor AM-OR11-026]|uniref:Uncharacterized protein n=1 Tax=Rhizopogon vinicolor AM-OR11-026 TaxID=1314800 RepID=A0A1B7N4M5_9AGAM|nr:hypothetical protein K503DRAFT_865122 [Rhizopogon vinicolor AM-OR11-026]